ncbi:MAG: hypothetical protein AAF937_07410 [Planctomycetota bacterium]
MRILVTAVVASACGVADAQTSIRYDITLAVRSNTIAATDPGTTFASVPAGSPGMLSIEASTTPFADFGDANTLSYPVLSATASVGGIDLMLDQSGYPSPTFLNGLGVSNDVSSPFFGPNADLMTSIVSSLLADVAFVGFSVGGPGDGTLAPGLWDSVQLPSAIDLGLPGVQGLFSIDGPKRINSDGQLLADITAIEITLVPAPGSAALLTAGLLLARRRR